jgi:hypothetical protein
MAAAGALSFGDSSDGQELVDLLPDTTDLRQSEPTVTVGDFAAYTLKRFVAGPDLSAATTPESIGTAWQQWWADHGGSLEFDQAARMWRST